MNYANYVIARRECWVPAALIMVGLVRECARKERFAFLQKQYIRIAASARVGSYRWESFPHPRRYVSMLTH